MTAIDRIETQISEIQKDRELASAFIQETRDPDEIEEYDRLKNDPRVIPGIRYVILDSLARKYDLCKDDRDSAEVNSIASSHLGENRPQDIISSIAVVRFNYGFLCRLGVDELDRLENISRSQLRIEEGDQTTSFANPTNHPPQTHTYQQPPNRESGIKFQWRSPQIAGLLPIVVGSMIVGMLIVLGMAINQSQQPQKVASTPTPSVVLPNYSTNPPDRFIVEHYNIVNQGDYDRSWNQLTVPFRTKKTSLETGYQEYLKWWDTVEKVDIISTKIVKISNNTSVVDVRIKYNLKTGNRVSNRLRFFLVRNDDIWLIAEIEHR
jgi:hypothetical protein